MDNWKEAYDELVHKHLSLKEKYEEIEDNEYNNSDMWGIFVIGILTTIALGVIIAGLAGAFA